MIYAAIGGRPSANSSIILRLNAGISSGLRLVTSPLSTTTSRPPIFHPALRISVWIAGHDVILRPFAMPASTSTHGPWQIAAIGLPASAKSFGKRHRLRVRAQRVGISATLRESSTRQVFRPSLIHRQVHRHGRPSSVWVHAVILPDFSDTTFTSASACQRFSGFSNSTYSNPSAARMAIFLF